MLSYDSYYLIRFLGDFGWVYKEQGYGNQDKPEHWRKENDLSYNSEGKRRHRQETFRGWKDRA